MRWTEEMNDWWRENVPGRTLNQIRALFYERFGIELTVAQAKNHKSYLGVKSGTIGGRWAKGHRSWNKGIPQAEYMSPDGIERTKATRFQPGEAKTALAKVPIGTERVRSDGYIEVKVSETTTTGKANGCWRFKHRLVWEEANGRPAPDGCMIVFCDGNNRNFDPNNLALETRAEHAVIAHTGIKYHDRESHDAAVLVARIQMKRSDLERPERVCWSCGETFKPKIANQKTCRECLDKGIKKRTRGRL